MMIPVIFIWIIVCMSCVLSCIFNGTGSSTSTHPSSGGIVGDSCAVAIGGAVGDSGAGGNSGGDGGGGGGGGCVVVVVVWKKCDLLVTWIPSLVNYLYMHCCIRI